MTQYDIDYLKENIGILGACERRFIDKFNKKQMQDNKEKMEKNSQNIGKELFGFNLSDKEKALLLGVGLFSASFFLILDKNYSWAPCAGLGMAILGVGFMDKAFNQTKNRGKDNVSRVSVPAHPLAKINQKRLEREQKKLEKIRKIIDDENKRLPSFSFDR